MYVKFYPIIVSFSIFATCLTVNAQVKINKNGNTISTRIATPKGFTRTMTDVNSFAGYLQKLPLKPDGTEVRYYTGAIKPNNLIYCAVVDMDIDKANLQQCADAVMRLRGEYLFQQKKYDAIHFNFISDGKPRYFNTYTNDYSYTEFRKYMKYIFSYANTRSLKNELESIPLKEMKIGDVLIQSGNPYGHAVIVVDMCEHTTTGEKLYLLAQSYMPAQETQILINRNENKISPWYRMNENSKISTPEWQFESGDLRRFE